MTNNAKESIVKALVTVCGQTIELKGILPNKNAPGFFEVKSDSHYDVKIEFESGRKLQKAVGYVTNGLNYQHGIVVTDTGIQLIDGKATKGRGAELEWR